MSIASDALEAFLTIYQQGSFTSGAKKLGLTQSAASQKLARLEEMLQTPLFVRLSKGLALTSAGEKLLFFAKSQLQQEQEFLRQFNQYSPEPGGVYRLAGFSSITRSLLMPALAPWLRLHSKVSLEFSSHEVIDLLLLLRSNKVDAVVLDYLPNVSAMESIVIGEEEYVIIESVKYPDPPDVYLDHGPHDNATESYMKFIGQKVVPERRYMGDVYAILDGVAMGLGRAVMSHHLVVNDKRFKILRGQKRYKRPLVLCFFRQNYYSPIHQKVVELLFKKGNL